MTSMIPTITRYAGRRDLASRRGFTLAERPPFPVICTDDRQTLIRQANEVVRWCDVERSARWAPVGAKTYCNVYASDVADLLGYHIPRRGYGLRELEKMDAGGSVPPPVYGETEYEYGANTLYEWFVKYGHRAGWALHTSLDSALAQIAATGAIGVISGRNAARRPNGSRRDGHITVLVAQPDGSVLESEAGSRNRTLGEIRGWELGRSFEDHIYAVANTVAVATAMA